MSQDNAFVCEVCGRTFRFSQGLGRHMKAAHAPKLPPPVVEELPVPEDNNNSAELKQEMNYAIMDRIGLLEQRAQEFAHRAELLRELLGKLN